MIKINRDVISRVIDTILTFWLLQRHMFACAHTHAPHTYTQTHRHIYTFKHTHVAHTQTHRYTHTRGTHTDTQVHTQTHTHRYIFFPRKQ